MKLNLGQNLISVMIEKFVKFSLSILLIFFINITLMSQNIGVNDSVRTGIKLNIGADIVSRYLFRGTDLGNSPAIQPSLSLSVANLELGAWGSVATNNSFKEIDLFVKYTFKNISLILTDYYIPLLNGIPASPDNRFLIYNDRKTAHSFEASVLWKGNESFPFWLLGGVFFYGNDKRWGCDAEMDSIEKTYYSTYLEAGYTFTIKDNNADLFVAFTPGAGAYGRSAGFVNIGITGCRKIKISNDFELPVKASLIFNPLVSNVFFVFGITI